MLNKNEFYPYYKPYITKFSPENFTIDQALELSREKLVRSFDNETLSHIRKTYGNSISLKSIGYITIRHSQHYLEVF